MQKQVEGKADPNPNPNPNPNPEQVKDKPEEAWLGLGLGPNPNPSPNPEQVKDKVEEAAEVGEMFTRDWACEPVPSRGTSKDRRRQMEGEQLKREAEERAGRSLGEERYGDRDRYADRRYDRGGDRYGDRGGDRYAIPTLTLTLALALTHLREGEDRVSAHAVEEVDRLVRVGLGLG